MPDDDFDDFIRRIRAGDAPAAAELLRRYEAVVRLEVRARLRSPHLRRVFDSMDVCQSVFAGFFIRAAAGHYDLDRPDDLLRLLVVIARNKVAYHARRQATRRRGGGRVEEGLDAVNEPGGREPSPSEEVAGAELLEEFRRRLSAEERRLAELRARGRGWAEIAAEVGGTAQARRVQLARAVERVAAELGLDEVAHE